MEILDFLLGRRSGGSGGDELVITDASYLFYKNHRVDQLDELMAAASGTSCMDYAFYGCTDLRALDMSSFDTSNCKSMINTFEGCENLTEIVGFSAVGCEGSDVVMPRKSTSGECTLRRLTMRVDLPAGQCAFAGSLFLSGAPMNRAAMVEFFNTLPDLTAFGLKGMVEISGAPAVTGTFDVLAGSAEGPITDYDTLAAIIEDNCLQPVSCYATLAGSDSPMRMQGEQVLRLAAEPGFLPLDGLSWDAEDNVDCPVLTTADREIATAKGWQILGG